VSNRQAGIDQRLQMSAHRVVVLAEQPGQLPHPRRFAALLQHLENGGPGR
jgi:hypothetical protein